MTAARVLIIDSDPDRRAVTSAKLRSHQCEVIEAASDNLALVTAHENELDLALVRVRPRADFFHQLTEVSRRFGAFIVLVVERSFSPLFRKELLACKVDGFLHDDLPEDEWIASIDAFIRQKHKLDELKPVLGSQSRPSQTISSGNETLAPLRDRSPDLYKHILRRYEEGIKRVLQHKIYKSNDDAFEPFRQIAKHLFQAEATARDAVELHYQTLRKIVPAPDVPGAQAYLEIGRTTIIGLLGDLLSFYRDACRHQPKTNSSTDLDAGLTEAPLNK